MILKPESVDDFILSLKIGRERLEEKGHIQLVENWTKVIDLLPKDPVLALMLAYDVEMPQFIISQIKEIFGVKDSK